MEEISLSDVLKNFGLTLFCFAFGCFLGVFIAFTFFYLNQALFTNLIKFFSERIIFGAQYVGSYKLWFIINNLFVTLLLVASSVFMMSLMLRRRRPKYFKGFKNMEIRRPKVTLYSLYIIPIGALIINGALVSMILVYGLLNFGYSSFKTAFLLLLPHGMSEILSLIFASSIGLAYLEVLKPYILKRQWGKAREIGRKLLFSNTTLFVVVCIAILVIFSGYIEGSFAVMIT